MVLKTWFLAALKLILLVSLSYITKILFTKTLVSYVLTKLNFNCSIVSVTMHYNKCVNNGQYPQCWFSHVIFSNCVMLMVKLENLLIFQQIHPV